MKDSHTPKGAVRAQHDTAAEPVVPIETPTASSTNPAEQTPPGAGVTADQAAAEVQVAAEPAAPKPRYTVADGKSITSLKGIIDAGREVRPEYFAVPKGERQKAQQLEALNALVAAGVVVDNSPDPK